MKSKIEDNMGISQLLSSGKLVNDRTRKAELLVNQFSSIFTKEDGNSSPQVSRHVNEQINNLTITEEGTQKLLNNIQTSKVTGPDNRENRVLKECSIELAPAIRIIFQKSIDSGTLPEDWNTQMWLLYLRKPTDINRLTTDQYL